MITWAGQCSSGHVTFAAPSIQTRHHLIRARVDVQPRDSKGDEGAAVQASPGALYHILETEDAVGDEDEA